MKEDEKTKGKHADKTEIKHQKVKPQEDISESLTIFEGFANSSPIGLYIVQGGKFQYVNPMFEKILGYDKEELIGTDSLSYVCPEDRKTVRANAIRMVKGEYNVGFYPYEYRVVCKSGEPKWIMEIVAPIQYEGRRATLGNFMDITERKRMEEEKIRFLNFLGIAAHDLKAPLTAIQGFIWLLLKGFTGPINEKQRNILERSSIRITELMTLVSDLLDIPRIEKGQILPEMKEIALGDVVKQGADELYNQAGEKGLDLRVNIADCPSTVNGSPARLKQVVINLIHNAITYTPSGVINVTLQEKGKNIVVEVADTGIGIPSDELPKIFEDFFRASNASTKGTGLGLSISRRIVEAHGGKIYVESPCKNGLGTKFTFSIPTIAKGE